MKLNYFVIGYFSLLVLIVSGIHALVPSKNVPDTTELSVHSKIYEFSEAEISQPKVSTLKAQLDTTGTGTIIAASKFWDIVKENWGSLLMAFLALVEVYIRASPSESDNSIFNLLKRILDAIIPNKSTSGGLHP